MGGISDSDQEFLFIITPYVGFNVTDAKEAVGVSQKSFLQLNSLKSVKKTFHFIYLLQ